MVGSGYEAAHGACAVETRHSEGVTIEGNLITNRNISRAPTLWFQPQIGHLIFSL